MVTPKKNFDTIMDSEITFWMFTYESEERKTIMKQKKPLNEVIYLPEYYAGKFSLLLQKEKTSEITYNKFRKLIS